MKKYINSNGNLTGVIKIDFKFTSVDIESVISFMLFENEVYKSNNKFTKKNILNKLKESLPYGDCGMSYSEVVEDYNEQIYLEKAIEISKNKFKEFYN